MITRDEIRQLAQIESPAACAVSFYFQPRTPQDKSHREESILVKDLVRDAMRRAERAGNHRLLREDLQRVLQAAERLHGNHSRGKAIFACQEKGIWLEFDVPPKLGQSQIKVDSRFHLRPLVAAQSSVVRACIALVNRQKARIFEMNTPHAHAAGTNGNGFRQMPDLEFGPLPRTGRSDGYLGYDAGHRERHAENEIKGHFKFFAESLQSLLNQDKFDALLIGCHDEAWPELQPLLHTYLKQRLVGRFVVDPAVASAEEVRAHAARILEENHRNNLQSLVREVIGEAQRNARGAVGLRHVIAALERQEVQTLLVGPGLSSQAVECPHCRHLDTRMVRQCAICGHETRDLSDVTDALVDLALRNGADIQFYDDIPELDKAGNVGALLRFRADQNTAERIAV
jgi:peptide subunit release factor 1 (eRF1)